MNMTGLDIDLTLFDSGAGEGGGADAAPEQGGQTAQKDGGAKGPVAYGKQTKPAGEPSPEEGSSPEEPSREDAPKDKPDGKARREQFDRLIQGEFRDLFEAKMSKVLEARSEEVNQWRGQVDAVAPVLDLLGRRYGVDPGDPAAVLKAVEQDDDYWERAAQEAGMNMDQYRAMEKLEREVRQLRREREATLRDEAVGRQVQQWRAEGEKLRETYPGFDLEGECQNPQFVSLLRSGVGVKAAYEVLHMDEIKNGVAAGAAKATERAVTETIKAKGKRPAENGAAGQSGVLVKDDVTKLTKHDREEIMRRVARGERIVF